MLEYQYVIKFINHNKTYINHVFSQGYCTGFHDVLNAYNQITPSIRLSGPTSFAPLIHQAIDIVKKTKSVSIL